jgi:phospholipid transport system substrate-binding protein
MKTPAFRLLSRNSSQKEVLARVPYGWVKALFQVKSLPGLSGKNPSVPENLYSHPGRAVMTSVILRFTRYCMACMLLAAVASVRAAEPPALSAEAAVDAYITNLLTEMETIKPLYGRDRKTYFAAVEEALSEFVDFREVARGVMAKYGTGPNGATPEQVERFADVFRASLVDFYGSALANYGGAKFEIVPLDTPPADPENATNVRMNIQSDDGSRFEVQYTMFLNADRVWKLKNLYIEGVNLRRQYFSQFESMMMSNNYDIDKVIDGWNVSQCAQQEAPNGNEQC